VIRGLVVAAGLVLILGTAAAARTGERAAPTTLAKVRGSVDALAQDGHRIAWIKTHARCGRQVQILTLPGRRPAYAGSRRGRSCAWRGGPIGAIALAGDGRVMWQGLEGFGNTETDIDLVTAALRAPRTRLVAALTFEYNPGNPDDYIEFELKGGPLPTAADGKAILFYSVCEVSGISAACPREGAIYRLIGRRSRQLAKVTSPVGLAVSGRRFAVVTNSLRCCNFTPVWSHDGTRLAWIYHGNLWTIRADGTGDRQLATEAARPSWSPDDARLVFEHAEAHKQHGVYRVDTAGGDLKRLASGTSPAWSPDRARIAFVRGRDVYAVDPDGRGETKLTTTARPTAGPLSWSPDSMRIAVSRGGDIYFVRADGTGETRLTTSAHAERQPAWSPNGAKIAYVDESESSPGIALVNADGTGPTRLTKARDRSPAWSPDSSRIAFVRVKDEQGALWVLNADGSGQRRLVPSNMYVDSPQWAPDGSSIAVGDFTVGTYPIHPGIGLVSPVDGRETKIAPVRHSPVQIRDALTGRVINRFTIDGHAHAIALGRDYVAMLVDHDPGVRVELYNLNGSFRSAAAVPSGVRKLSAAGRDVVFATGRVIRRLDVRTGVVTALATARRTPVGLTIEGRRIVWAENARGAARIRAVTAR
jgi:Tol biopolymer transport system component